MKRTDIHRPSAINPEDYHYVGLECLKIEGAEDVAVVLAERERIRKHMELTGGTYSHHQHGGSCHVCGAHAVYTVLFHHVPTNTYVRTGGECAGKLDACDIEGFRKAITDAREAAAGKRKAQAVLGDAGLTGAWEVYERLQALRRSIYAQGRDALSSESKAAAEELHRVPGYLFTVEDVVAKLVKYGSLSEAQLGLLRKLLERAERAPAIAAQRAQEEAAAQPVPVLKGRVKVSGAVLTVKTQDGYYGPSVKMLVQHADGWKVWGTLPASLDARRGDVVEFEAVVTRSDKDEKFGFFSRPTKGRVVAAAAQQQEVTS